jgi:hypothetical protein
MSAETLVLEQNPEELDKESAVFIAVLFVLVLYAITGSQLVLAAISALGLIYVVPPDQFRRMFGYLIFLDISFGYWLIGVASATLGGFTVATITGLMYTVSKGLAALAGQAIAWGKAVLRGVKDGHVEAPTPLEWRWVEVQAAGGFAATQTCKAFAKLRRSILG